MDVNLRPIVLFSVVMFLSSCFGGVSQVRVPRIDEQMAYPAPESLPDTALSKADMDQIVANDAQLVYQKRVDGPFVNNAYIDQMKTVLQTIYVQSGSGAATAFNNMLGFDSVKSLGMAFPAEGAMVMVNDKWFGPFDTIYGGHFTGILSASSHHTFHLLAFAEAPSIVLNISVSNTEGSVQYVFANDISRYVGGRNAKLKAKMPASPGEVIRALLVAPDGVSGWILKAPWGGSVFEKGKPSLGIGRFHVTAK
jgi:hypothetical protein